MSTDLKPVRLIMVTAENNNKFYNMTPQGSTFLAEWGRVGVTSSKKSYPIGKWNSTYNEKLKKGYKDVTEFAKVTEKKGSGYVDIPNANVNALFNKLLGFAKTSVKANYTISSDAVTQAQVTEAQGLMDELTKLAVVGTDHQFANRLLIDLYMVIPRRMAHVQDHLLKVPIKTDNDLQYFRNIIDSEQKTLDVMAGQVKMHQTVDPQDDNVPDRTILDALGIIVDTGDHRDEAIVKKLMANDAREFRAVYRVTHKDSRVRFDTHLDSALNKKTDLFWHGSRNENWISILQTGLKIRPSNAVLTGAMFGHGIYFADKYRKSANYTSLRGSYWAHGSSNSAFLALMDVHLGKQLEILRHSHECYNYNKNVMQQKGGYDSVFAKGGADLINNEYIVYDDAQSTIKYLIEVGN